MWPIASFSLFPFDFIINHFPKNTPLSFSTALKTCFLAPLLFSLHQTLRENANIFQSLNILVLAMAVTPENFSLFLNDNYILWTGRQRHQTSEPCDQSDPPTALPVCVCLRERERTKSKKSSKCIQLRQMSQLHLRQNRIRDLKLDPEMLSDHTIFQRIAGACCHCMLVPFVLARVGLQRRFLYRDDTCALECTCWVVLSCVAPPSPSTTS